MNVGKFNAALNSGESLLKTIKLLSERNRWPNRNLNDAAELRRLDYFDQWKFFIQKGCYDLLLLDQSFFLFSLDPYPSFSFYECPLRSKPFEEFAKETAGDNWHQFRFEIRDEYEQYINTLEPTKPAVPARYDYDKNSYVTGRHPAAHVHLGFQSNIRIATDRELTPLSFILFVVRQYFPEYWTIILDSKHINKFSGEVRDNLQNVPEEFRNKHDFNELYFA